MNKRAWEPLPPGKFRVRPDQPGVDPMWVWADSTHYRDHFPNAVPQQGVWFVVETPGTPGADRFSGKRLTVKDWEAQKPGMGLECIELAEPVVPERPPVRVRPDAVLKPRAIPVSGSDVLVGIIDSGCPFAAQMIRDADGKTRVLSIWDQDEAPSFVRNGVGHLPAGFSYGCAVNRSTLNKLMKDAAGDEDRCYRLADYDCLRERFSHGASVMSLLFGKPIYGGALQPEPGRRPSWDVADGDLPIDRADLVFVQIPRAGVQDSTSAALSRYIIDGLRYIAAHAGPKTKRIVVNISSGTSRTMHDGTSLLERALAEWVLSQKKNGVEGHIVVPVGNTNLEQRHATLANKKGPLVFFLPPDCEMPQYVTVRIPRGATRVRLLVTPPGGETIAVRRGEAMGWPNAARPECGVVFAKSLKADAPSHALIAFAPTSSPDRARPVARSGRWIFQLSQAGSVSAKNPVRFWISRNQRNPGAKFRSRQADFVDFDEAHSPRRYLRATLDDPGGQNSGNGIRRRGALSGMATVADATKRFVVVGGYIVATGVTPGKVRPSKYSAPGPAADPLPAVLPVFTSAPSDTSRAIKGLSARGNRSGEIVRVVGTSFSAPLVARALINGVRLRKHRLNHGEVRDGLSRCGIPLRTGAP